jgi:preprotein translocase subunit Sec61beta
MEKLITNYQRIRECMSKKRKKESPMPATTAGLLRFFDEEGEGLKLRPEIVVIIATALIVSVIIAHIGFRAI